MPYPSSTLYPKVTGLYPGAGVPEVAPPPGTPSTTTHGATEKLQPGRYMLRHIAPLAVNETDAGVYRPVGAGVQVLAKTLYADPLPQLRLPTSPDWHEGNYTLRVLDAGEWMVGFPNRDASDGQPWRNRFNAQGHSEFIEIAREGELEFVGCIVKQSKDRGSIKLAGYDGLFLLKKAFEPDTTIVTSPRDFIERYSRLPVTRFSTNFESETGLPTGLTSGSSGGGGVVQYTNHGLIDNCSSTGPESKSWLETEGGVHVFKGRSAFSMSQTFNVLKANGSAATPTGIELRLWDSEGPGLETRLIAFNELGPSYYVTALFYVSGTLTVEEKVSIAGAFVGPHSISIDGDDQWARIYWDGVLIAVIPYRLEGEYNWKSTLFAVANGRSIEVLYTQLMFRERQDFLMRGVEKGQYVLPGGVGVYPTGGLHARYHLYSGKASALLWQAMAPDPRAQGFPNFKESQELCNITEPGKVVGLPAQNLCMRMFGAIYLPLSKGNVTLQVNRSSAGVGFRVFVGKTQWDNEIIVDWSCASGTAGVAGTVNAAALGGKDGWYPIVIDAAWEVERGIALLMVPNGTYTDPGGTELKAGVGVVVPATSLSPVGCVDSRVQGASFFDLVQETARNWGLQLTCVPKQLESGNFPGQIVPSERLGRDTDEILEAGDIDKRSEFNQYTATEDATDIAASLRAFGSGIADGKGSQVAFEAIDPAAEASALFDIQAWLSAGDIAFEPLLAARANAELGLRSEPWENVEGEPIARDRLADTFPLTGQLAAFKWQPGDGVRLRLPDVAVEDVTPRQILQITRNFSPDGRTGTSIGFRARPKDPHTALHKALREATRPPRAFQRQYTTRQSSFLSQSIAAAGFSEYVMMALETQEKIVAAYVFLAGIFTGGNPAKVGLEINATDRTAALGGPWTNAQPINISQFAQTENGGQLAYAHRLYIRFKNEAAEANTLQGQIVLTILA